MDDTVELVRLWALVVAREQLRLDQLTEGLGAVSEGVAQETAVLAALVSERHALQMEIDKAEETRARADRKMRELISDAIRHYGQG
jgi:hypothetical protein